MPSSEENKRNESLGSYDVDDIAELSAEEIDKLLAEGTGENAPKETPKGDVLDMLEDTEDDDLWEIRDMLKKSDRDEVIDEKAEEDAGQAMGPADRLLADIEAEKEEDPANGGDAKKTQKAQEKARKAEEKARKAEERKRLKEEKAQKRKADKAEKSAKRGRRKRGEEETPEKIETVPKEPEGIAEYDLLLDKDLLDSIVSDAGKSGQGESGKAKKESSGFSVNELGEEYDAAKEREREDEAKKTKEATAPAREAGAGSGIMELDMEDVDALIPDITEVTKEEPPKERKAGLMSKIITLLTEEEEPENENLPISEENQEILKDLDNEKAAGDKGKKQKKAKKPAKKKEKKEKKKKTPKPPKPKKVKEAPANEPGRKISFKKMLPILLLGASVGAAIFIFVNLAVDFSVKFNAAAAFRKGDYGTCYQSLHGKKMTEEQAKMYGKSESILYMEQMRRKYDIFVKEGSQVEAVDSLIQVVHNYPAVSEYAAQWDALLEVNEIYSGILGILYDGYGVTEEQAKEIAALKSNIAYTRAVTAVAEGNSLGAGADDVPEDDQDSTSGEIEGDLPDGTGEEPPLSDQLPEEEGLGEGNFVDNE